MAISKPPGFKYLGKHNGARYLILTLLVFAAGVGLAVINWENVKHRDYTQATIKYNQELNNSKSVITTTLSHYSSLLGEGAGLYSVYSSTLNQSDWLAFFQSQHLTTSYPGAIGVNFAQYVPASDVSDYLSNMQNQGQSNFTITPAGDRDVYVPDTYIGYVTPRSLQDLGFDQLTNPVPRAALTQALNSGNITMSNKVALSVSANGDPGFVLYKPVYNGPSDTESDRQSSITGFVYVVVDSKQLFNALLANYVSPGVDIQIYDGKPLNANLLYQTPDFTSRLQHINKPFSYIVTTQYGGKTWSIRVILAQALLEANSNQSALTELTEGIILSLFGAGIVWYFTYYRARKMLWQRQMEVQAAKDELLSLAAHQLRTPATIVKQYLGILLQNFTDDTLTAQQREIVKTAYDSNEHQLYIANQFLNVARLESGRIKLDKKKLVANTLLQKVVDEQREIAKARRQRLVYKNPKTAYRLTGDPKYLPMVFENLISNALKYSKRGSSISIGLRKSGDNLFFTVSDHGVGIAADERAVIFEKFTRGSTEVSSSDGTGIGLHLAKQIVTLHKGSIEVESTVGKGSKFTVILPASSRKKPHSRKKK